MTHHISIHIVSHSSVWTCWKQFSLPLVTADSLKLLLTTLMSMWGKKSIHTSMPLQTTHAHTSCNISSVGFFHVKIFIHLFTYRTLSVLTCLAFWCTLWSLFFALWKIISPLFCHHRLSKEDREDGKVAWHAAKILRRADVKTTVSPTMALWQLSASVKMLLEKNFKILHAVIKQHVTCYTLRQRKHLRLSGNQTSDTARVNVLYIF